MSYFKPSGALPQEILDELVSRIVAATRPERIIQFGSAARGTMGPNSDVDLLVVKAGTYNKLHETQAIYLALGEHPVAVDVVLVTPEEVDRLKDVHHCVVKPAVREGREVYAA